MSDLHIPVRQLTYSTVDGPGERALIEVAASEAQGEVWSVDQLLHAMDLERITGITLTGDDPFNHALELSEIARIIHQNRLTVMVYTRYSLEELQRRATNERGILKLLHHTDLLVSGQLDGDRLAVNQYGIGSTNQSVHFLSSAYEAKELTKRQPSTQIVLEQQDQSTERLSSLGWPYGGRGLRPVEISSPLICDASWLRGKQWLTELFERPSLSVLLSQHWNKNESYWAFALSHARTASVQWLLTMNMSEPVPCIAGDHVSELSLFELELHSILPLRMGPALVGLLGGPEMWREQLKLNWQTGSVGNWSHEAPPKWLDSERGNEPIGDWLCLASLWAKLTRTDSLRQICTKYMRCPLSQREQVHHWLAHHSPLCALLSPRRGGVFWGSLTPQKVNPSLRRILDMVSRGLSTVWARQTLHERAPEIIYTADGWAHLEAISMLNEVALRCDLFSLGDACLTALHQGIRLATPEQLFSVSAASIDQLVSIRKTRLKLLKCFDIWVKQEQQLSQTSYGDEEYPRAQMTRYYLSKWRSMIGELAPYLSYAERLMDRADSPSS